MKWRAIVAAAVAGLVWMATTGAAETTGAKGSGLKEAEALRLAIQDLTQTYGEKYPRGREWLRRLEAIDERAQGAVGEARAALQRELKALEREALLANPLLDFDKLLLVRRGKKGHAGFPANWEGNSSLPPTGYDNEIAVLSPVRPEGRLTTLYKPEGGRFVGDVDLEFDGGRMLFSMPAANNRWRVWEVGSDGKNLRCVPQIDEPDVDNYDACYLPDGNIIFSSTACFTGVPCVTGSAHVANLYRVEVDSGRIRRLTFEQDHDWCPTVLPDGRVMYLRWEYSDLPHFVSRILFQMNPDGTTQSEYYGSNSYWPNSMFYARPVPGQGAKFVAVISGHHDTARMGELVLFDASKGRREAEGALQRIPGRGRKVEPVILDRLVSDSWPKFLHPWPLSEKYFLVAAQPTSSSSWGIYLVDVFDNMTLIKELEGNMLLEPVPLKKTPRPPVVPEKVDAARKDALVYIADVYAGEAMKGVARGTVRKLRLFTYQFAYHGMGGQVNRIGLDGPWDVKRIIGTVPVEADGSALFRVPANVPISMQPLDQDGRAVQLMRSWMTAMPGETVSCAGCHEKQNTSLPSRNTIAARQAPAEIAPWHGPTRGFGFEREVQPVLDRLCVGCHNGQARSDGAKLADFTRRPMVHPGGRDAAYTSNSQFPPAYLELRQYVRGHTIESDMHVLMPYEFHAGGTQLALTLEKGHYGVKMDAEAWDRINTWIDLNTPAHGTWREIVGDAKVNHQRDRRLAMMKAYGGDPADPETPGPMPAVGTPVVPAEAPEQKAVVPTCAGWPFDAAEAQKRQAADGAVEQAVDLGNGVMLKMVRIPAGRFVMGSGEGFADERPMSVVEVARPFWMATLEVTNEQYAKFDPTHDSRLETGDFLQFSVQERGYPTNGPKQPVCRVSWNEATAFCRWLSEKTGRRFTLPTEAQWEWACRAGSATPLNWGAMETDFGTLANLADASLRHVDTFGWNLPSGAIQPWRPAIEAVNDEHRVSAPVGSYKPNAWGLFDMHGNVAEWTRTSYRSYLYREEDGRNEAGALEKKVVRGGSWWDRPRYARSAMRRAWPAHAGAFDVGFRVICEP